MHLFSKENIWLNPQQFPAYNPVIQTRTIILWTELFPKKRREKIQGEILQSTFEYKYSGVSTFLQELHEIQHFYKFPVIPCRSLQGIYMAESSHKAPYSIPGPYSTSRLPVILPGRNSILSSSQHPRTPYSSSQASSTLQNSTRRNRILPKGLSIVYPIQY